MGNEIAVRVAQMRDADVLARANIAMAWETERTRLDAATVARGVRAVLANPEYGFYVVALIDGEIAGSLLITFEWSDWRSGLIWWIQSLYVQPRFRRNGVFRRLYAFVRTQASQRPDVCGMRLYVEQANDLAQRAYSGLGLRRTRYTMYEDMFAPTGSDGPQPDGAPPRDGRDQ